jgi:UDP-glucose 4-epimerase
VRALIGLMERPDAYGQVFNIGNTEEVSILGLAQRVIAQSGSTSEIVFVPYERAYEPGFEDMSRRVPDVGKIGQLIGWTPTISLERILDDVIGWCRGAAT